jgi:hypothetical protein
MSLIDALLPFVQTAANDHFPPGFPTQADLAKVSKVRIADLRGRLIGFGGSAESGHRRSPVY